MQSAPGPSGVVVTGSAVARPPVGLAVPDALPDAAPWTGSWRRLATAWLAGVLVLAGLLVFVLHVGAVEVFLDTLGRADPAWLALPMLCQAATYGIAAVIWFRILGRIGAVVS